MRRTGGVVGGFLMLAAVGSLLAQATMVEDRGKFRVMVDGQQAGTEEFQITPGSGGWVARGNAEVKPAGSGSSRVTATMQLKADGSPVRYEWEITGEKKAKSVVTFGSDTAQPGMTKAQLVLNLEGMQPYTQEYWFPTAKVVILDNNMYHHYSMVPRVYDWSKKGAQSIPVLIPQDLTPGAVEAEATGQVQFEGKSYEGMKVRTSDLEIVLYFEARGGSAGPGRLIRIAVPGSKALVVRE